MHIHTCIAHMYVHTHTNTYTYTYVYIKRHIHTDIYAHKLAILHMYTLTLLGTEQGVHIH